MLRVFVAADSDTQDFLWTIALTMGRMSEINRLKWDKAKVKYLRFHALRHFGVSMFDSANIPIGSIQRILGHESRSTTEIYLHSIGDSERQAMHFLSAQIEYFSYTTKKGLRS